MQNWSDILKSEFDAQEGSFLIKLRCEATWDKEAFKQLFIAMRECCKVQAEKGTIKRWIAQGFWYLSWFPKQEAKRFGFDSLYYENALANLDHLAWWLFCGEARADGQFEPLDGKEV